LEGWYQSEKRTGGRSVDADGMRFSKTATRERVVADARQAVLCAAQLLFDDQEETTPRSTEEPLQVYFASDTVEAVRALAGRRMEIDSSHQNMSSPLSSSLSVGSAVLLPSMMIQVTGIAATSYSRNDHVHLGRGKAWVPLKAYYPLFVDMFLLAGGKCISVGLGGFGLFGGVGTLPANVSPVT
jgi:hypothetical protein